MVSSNQNKRHNSWTPEVIIQAFKEVVTALLGLLIVGYTFVLVQRALSVAGKQQEMSDAKDLLLLVLGLTGVVLGYYFGRVPADARASQAQEQANAATARTEQVTAHAQVIADRVDQVMGKVAPAAAAARGASSPALDTTVAADLQRIRDELRVMANLGR